MQVTASAPEKNSLKYATQCHRTYTKYTKATRAKTYMPSNFFDQQRKIKTFVSKDKLDNGYYEVKLAVNMTSTLEGEELYSIGVVIGGIFSVKNTENDDEVDANILDKIINEQCPQTLWPICSENIIAMLAAIDLPPFYLPVMDFRKQQKPA